MAVRYFNRDLSWLAFNKRVLYQAQDKTNPLLERIRFLSIFTSNLDEFFMKRMWRLKTQKHNNPTAIREDGFSLQMRAALIYRKIETLYQQRDRIFKEEILFQLKANEIYLVKWDELETKEKDALEEYFLNSIFPILTPLAVGPAHPFPFLSNLSQSIGLKLCELGSKQPSFARVKIPDVLSPWVYVGKNMGVPPHRMIRLEELIKVYISKLFPDFKIQAMTTFRVTRNADVDAQIDEYEEADDLVDVVEEELRQRRMGRVVRLEHEPHPDPWILRVLTSELELSEEDLFQVSGEMSHRSYSHIADLHFPDLKFKPWVPQVPGAFQSKGSHLFSVIQKKDILVHHPYHSFSASVEELVRVAVEDSNVLAIKMTVYRLGEESPLIPMLIEAASQGKQVVCVVEVKARFDEAKNIYWSERLEQAGVHVVYGIVGLKTHAKMLLIIRKEKDDIQTYVHIGTGNYNNQTASLYTDLGLFSAKKELALEVIDIFNYLTCLSFKKKFTKFLVAPVNMKERFLNLIQNEIDNMKNKKPAAIFSKMNSLEDKDICDKLYEASNAGVHVDLIVRGFCVLRPGVPSLSENIRVTSIIGRFLEHSRFFYFRNGSEEPHQGIFYMGSADWMPRNLLGRVETAVPIEDPDLKKQCWALQRLLLQNQKQTWDLQPNGEYTLRQPRSPEELGVQEKLMIYYSTYFNENRKEQGV
ncbi:MAG: polyphosphate kinase 1 [Deltaproteobacteria bacterium]|nr:polyphosphate kinase 1 [Deltaproteobacteria bacterium]